MARATDPRRAQAAATWIVRRLRDAGHTAYFAGGCVRDGLLGLHPTDFDVATDAAPQRVRSLFHRTSQVGAAFGVVLVYVPTDAIASEGVAELGPSVSVEVATFRSDGPYSDARRPDTIRFSDARSDADRRDFTINALFLDPLAKGQTTDPYATGDLRGQVIDYVGGQADLVARVVRAVGDPDKRLQEDHLRALRAVRFASRLAFTLDPKTAEAIRRHASHLRGVSRERIGEELRRMLSHPHRAQAVAMLQDLGLDAPVLLETQRAVPVPRLKGLAARATATTALTAWMLDRHATEDQPWLPDHVAGPLTTQLRAALCLSNQESEQLSETLRCVRGFLSEWPGLGVAGRKRLLGREFHADALNIVRTTCTERAMGIDAEVAGLASDGVGINPPIVVTGDDLIAGGLQPGPNFRRILDGVRDAQLEGRIRTKQEGMELARELNV